MAGRLARPILLFLSMAFGIVSMSVGINALVKSNQQKAFVKANAPTGVKITINTDDALRSGIVLTVGSGLLALVSFLSLAYTFLLSHRQRPKSLRLLSYFHFLLSTWVIATLIAFDVIVRTRSARITATLGSLTLPQSIIDSQESLLGVSPKYWSNGYLHTQAIIPWFAFLFGLLSGIALFRASNKAAAAAPATTHTRYVRDNEADVDGRVDEKDGGAKKGKDGEEVDEEEEGAQRVRESVEKV